MPYTRRAGMCTWYCCRRVFRRMAIREAPSPLPCTGRPAACTIHFLQGPCFPPDMGNRGLAFGKSPHRRMTKKKKTAESRLHKRGLWHRFLERSCLVVSLCTPFGISPVPLLRKESPLQRTLRCCHGVELFEMVTVQMACRETFSLQGALCHQPLTSTGTQQPFLIHERDIYV